MSLDIEVPGGNEEYVSHGTKVRKALALLGEAEAAREAAIAELLDERRAIEAKLTELGHTEKEKTRRKSGGRLCGSCGEAGHTARTCAKKAGKDTALQGDGATAGHGQRPCSPGQAGTF